MTEMILRRSYLGIFDRPSLRFLFSLVVLIGMAAAAVAATPDTTKPDVSGRYATANTNANVRADASADAPHVAMLSQGRQVKVLSVRLARDRSEWWQIADLEGRVLGFVAAHLMTPVADVAVPRTGSLFDEAMGLSGDGRVSAPMQPGASVFDQIASSGEIERAQEEARRRAEEEAQRRAAEAERERQEAAWREQERLERERFEAEERRRAEEQAEWEREMAFYDDDDPGEVYNPTADLIRNIEQGFQQLVDQRRSAHEETMRLQDERRQAEERRRDEIEQRQRQFEDDRRRREQAFQQQQAQRQQDIERQRQQLAVATARSLQSAQPQAQPQAVIVPKTGNPGRPALDCVRLSQEDVTFRDDSHYAIFTNACDFPIFVLWCGDSPYGPDCRENVPEFYASSANLAPRQSHRAIVRGRVHYGACEGGIGFGFTGFRDFDNGDYTCLPTGDFARVADQGTRSSPRIQSQP